MKRNMLVLFEDALRYDAYYSDHMKPVRDMLAPTVEFPQWYSVSNCSDPNIATMITGLSPWVHGVRHMGDYLMGRPTIFDEYNKAGYSTIFAGWGRQHLVREEDVDFYWQLYSPGHIKENRGPITAWAEKLIWQADEPWFAWVRHMWCHATYENGYWGSVKKTAWDLCHFIKAVRDKYPNTTILLTADHGEMLGGPDGPERGKIDAPGTPPQHAWGLFEPLVHVPMALSVTGASDRIVAGHFNHTCMFDLLHPSNVVIAPLAHLLMEGTGVDAKWRNWYYRGVITGGIKLLYGGQYGAEEPLLYFAGDDNAFDESHNQAQAFPATVDHLRYCLPPHLYKPMSEAEIQIIEDRLAALGYGE